jgi:5-methylcytosine-specific restriction endonuclease McrA
MVESAFRLYLPDELGPDGYPPEWHATLKHAVRAEAGHRCARCGHPYEVGAHRMEAVERDEDGTTFYVSWTPCGDLCRHGGPVRWSNGSEWVEYDGPDETIGQYVEAKARILTVHHLDGDKANCRWWNLAALCQRCHLTIQGRVVMARVWAWEHSDWFKPYVAGYYAHAYLGEDLTREQVAARLDELLGLELVA